MARIAAKSSTAGSTCLARTSLARWSLVRHEHARAGACARSAVRILRPLRPRLRRSRLRFEKTKRSPVRAFAFVEARSFHKCWLPIIGKQQSSLRVDLHCSSQSRLSHMRLGTDAWCAPSAKGQQVVLTLRERQANGRSVSPPPCIGRGHWPSASVPASYNSARRARGWRQR